MGVLHVFFTFLLKSIWHFVGWAWSQSKWLMPTVIALLCVGFLVRRVLIRRLFKPIYETCKKFLRYRQTLEALREILEAEYSDAEWADAKFCGAYLTFYGEYTKFLDVARRDYDGELIDGSPYDSFVRVSINENLAEIKSKRMDLAQVA